MASTIVNACGIAKAFDQVRCELHHSHVQRFRQGFFQQPSGILTTNHITIIHFAIKIKLKRTESQTCCSFLYHNLKAWFPKRWGCSIGGISLIQLSKVSRSSTTLPTISLLLYSHVFPLPKISNFIIYT
jgi:hypothetical protein